MNIGLHHFKLVDTIVKEGTVTKAAEALHLTQSALSHQLKELETEMDTAVFLRRGKRLELSEEGHRFLRSAQVILSEINGLKEDLLNYKGGLTGNLRIITQCYTAYHWLPCIIKYYKSKCPDINVQIASEAAHRPLEFLLRNELDVAIVKNKINDPNIRYEPIFEDQLLAIMSRNHPLAKKRFIHISDFYNEELYLGNADPQAGNQSVIETLLQTQQVKPKHIHRIHYTDAIIELVDSNLGVSVMADWIVQPYLESKDIVARPLPSELGKRTWYAATCKQNISIRNFLDCLKYHFSEMTMKINTQKGELVLPQLSPLSTIGKVPSVAV
ncbi:LysR family transcriptional regulator [Deminuibacter soli]|uniref:LysR family transcriptional regulator n=1 Tax=Deminuibacter soli TaxID=2291815 RepID=A0A3E1NC38_9BACT|nr:LysR family transcriptional regulator [Deminuibacter soli]RFM25585.1 LysR family transcriptional regulator [Deminuibacter soli]